MPRSEVRKSIRATDAARHGTQLAGWRLWLGVLLLLAVVATTASLGRWQLSRADQKRAIVQGIAAARQQPPLALSPAATADELIEWRDAWARGAWQPGLTVFLDNRNHDGRPGFWVVTPLCLSSPDAPIEPDASAVDCDRAVAVLRGWVPRPAPGQPAPVLQDIPRYQDVQGRLLTHLPRLFELTPLMPGSASAPAPLSWDAGAPVLQNLALADYAAASGLDFLPTVLEQSNDTGDGLLREWAGPPVDVDKHRGYALQWFSFAAIALIALGVILVKVLRRPRR